MDDSQRPQNLTFYEKAAVIKLTCEQAMLKLRAHADQGDPAAKELLEQLLPNAPAKDSEPNESYVLAVCRHFARQTKHVRRDIMPRTHARVQTDVYSCGAIFTKARRGPLPAVDRRATARRGPLRRAVSL
jgi:hypothetical protein